MRILRKLVQMLHPYRIGINNNTLIALIIVACASRRAA